jgi:hypothetical protein
MKEHADEQHAGTFEEFSSLGVDEKKSHLDGVVNRNATPLC